MTSRRHANHSPRRTPALPAVHQDAANDGGKLLRAMEVAQRLGVGIRTVWKLRATGRLPSVAIFRATRFRASDVERLAREGVR